MELLLDTHALIWFRTAHPNLSMNAYEGIKGADKTYISSVSLWETTLLIEKGKIPIREKISEFTAKLTDLGVEIIRFETKDLETILNLPQVHRDPFDRMLISQAINRDLTLITKDAIIKKYPLKTLW